MHCYVGLSMIVRLFGITSNNTSIKRFNITVVQFGLNPDIGRLSTALSRRHRRRADGAEVEIISASMGRVSTALPSVYIDLSIDLLSNIYISMDLSQETDSRTEGSIL